MSNWKKDGWVYKTILHYPYYDHEDGTSRVLVVERKLDFVSYHLISFIHGKDKLEEMAKAKPRLFKR